MIPSPRPASGRLLAAGLVLLLTACGGAGAGSPAASETPEITASPSPTPEPTPTPSPTPEPTPDLTAYNDCVDLLAPLADVLREIDSRLVVGINYSEFDGLLDSAAVEYGRLDPEELSDIDLSCITAGAKLEAMFNTYLDAHTQWGDCIEDPVCTNDSITPDLQEKWSTAETQLDEYDDALDLLRGR